MRITLIFTLLFTFVATAWGAQPVPAKVIGVIATQGKLSGLITLKWTAAARADSYDIYRSTSTGTQGVLLVSNVTVLNLNDPVSDTTHYFYTVVAINGSGNSPNSTQVEGWGKQPAPSQVIGVNASQTFYDKLVVSWSTVTGALYYDIYRSTSAGSKGSIIASNQTVNSFEEVSAPGGSATIGIHYFYTIVAKNGIGNSPDSSQAEGWINIPSTITDLTATKGTLQNKVGLTWSINPDATGYEIWRSTSSGGTATLQATTGVLATGNFQDTSVSGTSQYYYTVKTIIGAVKSLISNESMGYAIIATSKITNVTVTQGTKYGYIITNWTADPVADTYEVYRSTVLGSRGSLISTISKPGLSQSMPRPNSTHYFITVVARNALGLGPDSDQQEGWAKVPSAITDLTATKGTLVTKVGLTWSINPDATGYEIWRSTSSGGTATLQATTGVLGAGYYEDTTTSVMSQYYYTMKTLVGSQSGSSPTQSSFSNESMGYGIVAVSKITGLTATQGTLYGKSTVSWTADSEATSYDVYRSAAAGTKGALVGGNVVGNSFNDSTVSGATHYFYTLVAKNAASTSTDSAQVEGWGKIPSEITDLTGSKLKEAKIELYWTINPDATGYEIWRSINGVGGSTLVATTGALQSGYYSDTTVQDRISYNYRIITLADNAKSAFSNTGTGVAWLPPNKVTGLVASQGESYGQISITWNADPASPKYDLYKSTLAGTIGSRISPDQTTTSFIDTNVSGSTHYFYSVISKNPLGWGSASDQAEGWGNIPLSVNSLSATKGTIINSVKLTWSPIADATDYKVYRSTTSGGSFSLVGSSTTTNYDDSTSGFGITYYYLVKALVGTVEGAAGNEESGWGKRPVPVQVTGLGATQGTYYDKVTVSWPPATDADTYDVYQSTNSGTKGTVIASDLSDLTYDDTSAIGGAHYLYTVVAKNTTGNSPDSAQAVGWGKLLTSISSISASQGTLINAVDLSWSSVNDATSYNIYLASSSGGALILIGNSTTTNFRDTGSNYGIANYYKVSAMFGTVEGPKSNEAIGWGKQPTPVQVAGVVASQGTLYDKVIVSWTSTSGAFAYDIYRSPSLGARGSVISTDLTELTYDDTVATGGNHYFYTVVAKNATGNSPDSTQAEGWGKLPASINTLSASQGTVINAVQLNWSPVQDAISYKIYRSTVPGGSLTLLSSSVTTDYTDTTTGSGTAFYFKVTAVVGTVEGQAGNEATGWGKQPAPPQVSGVSASKGIYFDKVSVTWSSATGALTYDIYRSSSAGTKGSVIAPDQTGNNYSDGTASGGPHYFYTVVAKNGTGSSPDSSQAEGWGKLPDSVNTLNATQGTLTAKVKLTWVALIDATGYEVYRSTTAGSPGTLLTTVGTTASYDDNNALPGSAYYYTIKTKVSSLTGPLSNEAAGWSKQPAPISSVTATLGTVTGAIQVGWTYDPEASGYEIWRSDSSGGSASLIGTVSSANYLDSTVVGVSNYYYTVKTKVGAAVGPTGNEAKGFANAAPTSASVALVTTSYVSSPETLAIVADPNIDAGQGEALSFAVTEQTTTGMVSINNGKFLYTPPVDGLFSGPLSFKFGVTDRGGKTIAANGSVLVTCTAPSISTVALTTPVLIATEFATSLTYSIPACSKTRQIDINIFDNNNVLVSSAVLSNINNGIGNVALFNTKGLSKSGTFTVKAHVSTDLGEDIKTAQLVVKQVNLPIMGILPSTTVIDGKDTVDVTLQNPSVINCQFTKDKNIALTDSSKCFVELSIPPEGLTLDNTGAFPAFHGVFQKSGQYAIDATVSKFNGQDLLVVGKVSKTITSSCPQPTINSLTTTPNLLSYIKPSYKINYDALACNSNLSASLVITSNKDGSVIETKPLSLTDYGSGIDYSIIGQGLPEGGYTASLSIQGAEGTANKAIAFSVKQTPLPTIAISPYAIDQGETKISIEIVPSQDNSCPLTAIQSEAESDPRKCFVTFAYTVPGLSTVIDENGLPSVSGYTSKFGNFEVSLNVSRWVDGQRYDSKPVNKTLVVRSYSIPVFEITGKTDMFAGISKSDLMLKQTDGTNCSLFLSYDDALKNAIAGKKSCLATITIPNDISPVLYLNAVQLAGAFMTTGDKSISFTVDRVFSDGQKLELSSGSVTLHITEPPMPGMTFSGGTKISENKYFLQSGSAFTRLTVSTNPIPSAKVKITSNDGVQPISRNNITNGSSYWLTTENLSLLQERDVTVRVAWVDYPSIYAEKVLKVVGGPKGTPKLIVEAPQIANSTDDLIVKVKVGQYTTAGLAYDQSLLGQWKTQVFVETNNSSRSPVSDVIDLVNGEAEFKLNPANKLFMKISASADIVSSIDGLHYPIQSSTKFVSIINTAPLIGNITAKLLEAPAPKVFTLDLNMSIDNKVALKETHWEESIDDGVTWQEFEVSSQLRANIGLKTPSRKMVRVRMISKTDIVSYTEPVEVWAYSKLEANIVGPVHVAPGTPVTIGAELYRDGKITENAVYDWVVEYQGRTDISNTATVTINDNTENKVYVSLKARPSDTNINDKNAWTVDRHVIFIKKPTSPSVYASGQRDIEIGKTYHYIGTARPSWGNIPSVHTLTTEWELPDGTTVSGSILDWSPTGQSLIDRKPLIFRAWVEGFKDSTTKETTVSYVPWEYVWPNFIVSMKQLTVQAPSDVLLSVNHDLPGMNRRFEGLTYDWSFPANVEGRQNVAFPNRSAGHVIYAGEYDINVTVRDSRGHETVLTQHIVTEAAVPYSVVLKVGKSNAYERAPMTVTVRPTIYGGHPLDAVIGQLWKVDGVPVDEFTNRSYLVSSLAEAGNHVLSYTLNSRMGETTTVEAPLTLAQNQIPMCQLTAVPNVYVVYAEAKCTDQDGKVIGYSWLVNGQPISSTSYRISFGKTDTPQSASVSITSMDDAKELSIPVSINVNY